MIIFGVFSIYQLPSPKDILVFAIHNSAKTQCLLEKLHLIENQRSLWQIFKEPPLTSFKSGKAFKEHVC